MNRVLRELRESGLCNVRGANVQILDLKGLVERARFDPHYLYLNPQTAAHAVGHTGNPP